MSAIAQKELNLSEEILLETLAHELGVNSSNRGELNVKAEDVLASMLKRLEKDKSSCLDGRPFDVVENLSKVLGRDTISAWIYRISQSLKKKLMLKTFSSVRKPSILVECLFSDKNVYFPFYQNESFNFYPGTITEAICPIYFVGNHNDLSSKLDNLNVNVVPNFIAGLTARGPRWRFDLITVEETFTVMKRLYKNYIPTRFCYRPSEVLDLYLKASFFHKPLNIIMNSYSAHGIVASAVDENTDNNFSISRVMNILPKRRRKAIMKAQEDLLSACLLNVLSGHTPLEEMCKTENRKRLLRATIRRQLSIGSLSCFLQELNKISKNIEVHKDCFLLVFMLRSVGDEEMVTLLDQNYPAVGKFDENKQIRLLPHRISLGGNRSICALKDNVLDADKAKYKC